MSASADTTRDLVETKKQWGVERHWWVVITVFVQHLFDGATGELWPLFSSTWKKPIAQGGLGWTAKMLTAPRAVSAWIGFAMIFVTALVYERWAMKRRRGLLYFVLIGMTGSIISPTLYFFFLTPDRYWLYWFCYLFVPILGAFSGYGVLVLLTNWFSQRKGLAMGMTGAAAEGGTAIIWGALGGWMIPKFGWKWAYFIGGWSLPILGLPLHFFFNYTMPSDVGLLPYGVKKEEAKEAVEAQGARRRGVRVLSAQENWGFTLREVIKDRGFWILFACIFIAPLMWMPTYVGSRGIVAQYFYGISTQNLGIGVTIFGIWYCIQGTLLGWLCDHFGWDKRMSIAWSMLGGGVINAMVWKFLVGPGEIGWFYLGCVTVAMGIGGWIPLVAASASERYGPQAMGVVYSLYGRLPLSVATFVGTLWCGEIIDHEIKRMQGKPAFWSLGGHLTWLAIVGSILFFAVLLARRPKRQTYETIKRPPWWAVAHEPAPWELAVTGRKKKTSA